MAMIICPECKNEFSDKSESCPKCGFSTEYLKIEERIKNNKNNSDCLDGINDRYKLYKKCSSQLTLIMIFLGFFSLIFSLFCVDPILDGDTEVLEIFLFLLLPLNLMAYFGIKRRRTAVKLEPKLLDCFRNYYPIIKNNNLHSYYEVLDENKSFNTVEKSKEYMSLMIYAYANEIGADAIAIGKESSSIEIYGSISKGKGEIESIRKNHNSATFVKLK